MLYIVVKLQLLICTWGKNHRILINKTKQRNYLRFQISEMYIYFFYYLSLSWEFLSCPLQSHNTAQFLLLIVPLYTTRRQATLFCYLPTVTLTPPVNVRVSTSKIHVVKKKLLLGERLILGPIIENWVRAFFFFAQEDFLSANQQFVSICKIHRAFLKITSIYIYFLTSLVRERNEIENVSNLLKLSIRRKRDYKDP